MSSFITLNDRTVNIDYIEMVGKIVSTQPTKKNSCFFKNNPKPIRYYFTVLMASGYVINIERGTEEDCELFRESLIAYLKEFSTN